MSLSASEEAGVAARARTLVVGCPGPGAIAQFVAEVVATRGGRPRRFPMLSDALPPLAGDDPLGVGCGPATPLALYAPDDRRLPVSLVLRSPPSPALASAIAAWAKRVGVAAVVALGSAHAHENREVGGPAMRYVANESFPPETERALSSSRWRRHPRDAPVRGGRFARRVFVECDRLGVPALLAFRYSEVEFDERAVERTTDALAAALGLPFDDPVARRFDPPTSWSRTFDALVPEHLF